MRICEEYYIYNHYLIPNQVNIKRYQIGINEAKIFINMQKQI